MFLLRSLTNTGSELIRVARAHSVRHAKLRDRIVGVLIATSMVDLTCAVIALFTERHHPGTGINSLGTPIFWTPTQRLSASSSLPNPVSTAGRILDVLMEAYAITFIGSI